MTTEANRALDEAFGGEDGVSPIRFGRHESEQTVGRIRVDGGWDRRYKVWRQATPEPKPEPVWAPFLVAMLWSFVFWLLFVWAGVQ